MVYCTLTEPESAVRVAAVAPVTWSMVASAGVAHHGAVLALTMEWELARTALPEMTELMSGWLATRRSFTR